MARTPAAPGGRFVFLDGLRGIAALAVAWFHFYRWTPLHGVLQPAAPRALDWLLAHGSLGVDIFFVLSGFVIAYSTRDAEITGGFIGRFALRRALRLDPPYWATIALALGFAALSQVVLAHPVELPSGWELLAHFFYLQQPLGLGNIVSVFWTLCLEVQFYLLLIVLVGVAQRLTRRAWPAWLGRGSVVLLFGSLYLTSVLLLGLGRITDRWFIGFWHAFFLGALTYWTMAGRVRAWVWFAAVAVLVPAAATSGVVDPWVVLATAALIHAAARTGNLVRWLGARWVQYLGRISYSLYLVHFLGGIVAKLAVPALRPGPLGGVALFALATAVSLAAAEAMFRLVEAPSMRLARSGRVVEVMRGYALRLRGVREVSGFAE